MKSRLRESNYNYCGSVVRKIINQIALSQVYKVGESGRKTGVRLLQQKQNLSGYGGEEGKGGEGTATKVVLDQKENKTFGYKFLTAHLGCKHTHTVPQLALKSSCLKMHFYNKMLCLWQAALLDYTGCLFTLPLAANGTRRTNQGKLHIE